MKRHVFIWIAALIVVCVCCISAEAAEFRGMITDKNPSDLPGLIPEGIEGNRVKEGEQVLLQVHNDNFLWQEEGVFVSGAKEVFQAEWISWYMLSARIEENAYFEHRGLYVENGKLYLRLYAKQPGETTLLIYLEDGFLETSGPFLVPFSIQSKDQGGGTPDPNPDPDPKPDPGPDPTPDPDPNPNPPSGTKELHITGLNPEVSLKDTNLHLSAGERYIVPLSASMFLWADAEGHVASPPSSAVVSLNQLKQAQVEVVLKGSRQLPVVKEVSLVEVGGGSGIAICAADYIVATEDQPIALSLALYCGSGEEIEGIVSGVLEIDVKDLSTAPNSIFLSSGMAIAPQAVLHSANLVLGDGVEVRMTLLPNRRYSGLALREEGGMEGIASVCRLYVLGMEEGQVLLQNDMRRCVYDLEGEHLGDTGSYLSFRDTYYIAADDVCRIETEGSGGASRKESERKFASQTALPSFTVPAQESGGVPHGQEAADLENQHDNPSTGR